MDVASQYFAPNFPNRQMPAASMDADRRSTMTDPASALEQWHTLRFDAWKRGRTEAIAVLAQQEEDVYANRRALVKETRELKELEGEAQQHKVKDLLRLYQSEIDRLAKALKVAHGLYLEAFDPLRALPDPSDVLASCQKDQNSLAGGSFQDLEFIVSERDAEVSAARDELALYKQRDVVREAKIAELHSELEDLQAFRVSNVQKDAIIREQAEQIAELNAQMAAKEADDKEKRQLMSELREHADAVIKLTHTNRELEARLADMQHDVAKYKNQSGQSNLPLLNEIDELKQALQERDGKIELLSSQISELQAKCLAMDDIAEVAEKASALEGQVFTLQYELKAAQDELEKRESDAAELEKRMQNILKEDLALKETLADLKQQAECKKSGDVDAESKLASLYDTNASLTAQVAELMQSVSNFESEVDVLKSELDAKNTTIASQLTSLSENSKLYAVYESEKETSQARISELEARVAELQLAQQTNNATEDIKKANDEAAELQTELRLLTWKYRAMEAKHASFANELESMRAVLQNSESEVARLSAERESFASQLTADKELYEKRIIELNAELSTLSNDKALLSDQCDELKHMLAAQSTADSAIQSKLDTANAALEAEKALMLQLQTKLNDAQAELEVKIQAIHKLENAHTQRIDDLRTTLNSEIELLQARLDVARMDAESYEQKCLELQVEIDALTSGAVMRTHQSTERESVLEQELLAVRRELQMLQDEAALDEKEQLRQELARTISELDALRAKSVDADAGALQLTISQLEAELASCRLDMADLQAALAASNNKNDTDSTADYSAIHAEIAQLRQQQQLFDSVLTERDMAQAKLAELERMVATQPPAPMQQSNQSAHEIDLSARAQSLSQQLSQRNTDIIRLQNENRTLTERLRSLEHTAGFAQDDESAEVLLPMANGSSFATDTQHSGIFVALWNAAEKRLRVLNRSDRTLWRAGRVLMTNSLARRAILIYLAVIHSLVIFLLVNAMRGCPAALH